MTDYYIDMKAKAGCPLTTPDELSTLANSEFTLIRCKVAMNYSTSCDVLRKLAEDKTWINSLRVYIAIGARPTRLNVNVGRTSLVAQSINVASVLLTPIGTPNPIGNHPK